jgi:uncharacterized protein YecE (DUF72 family)
MEVFVGTSGWAYSWNASRRLDWFVLESGLNAIELNASFYRYPSTKTITTWAQKGSSIRWAIKVNRLFTHTYKFNAAAAGRWQNFKNLFDPLDRLIDFYLFQLPPSSTPHAAPQIASFIKQAGLGSRFALEVRNMSWFAPEWRDWAADLGVTLVSVDAPDLPRDIFSIGDCVYLRVHGRTGWYSHRYSQVELQEIAQKIIETRPKRVYVFFNNDTAMLENARVMRRILTE